MLASFACDSVITNKLKVSIQDGTESAPSELPLTGLQNTTSLLYQEPLPFAKRFRKVVS